MFNASIGKKLDAAEKKIRKVHCVDCGNIPAFVPRVHVLNMETARLDTYHLDLPPLCDSCVQKKGLTRHGVLVPKQHEFQKPSEMLDGLLGRIPDWTSRSLEQSIRDLVDQGMTEEDAKTMMGVE